MLAVIVVSVGSTFPAGFFSISGRPHARTFAGGMVRLQILEKRHDTEKSSAAGGEVLSELGTLRLVVQWSAFLCSAQLAFTVSRRLLSLGAS